MSVANIETRNVMGTKRVVDYPSSCYARHHNGLIKSASTSSCSASESNLFETLRASGHYASHNSKQKHGYSDAQMKKASFNERLKLFVLQPFSYSEQNMPLLATNSSSDSLPVAEKLFHSGAIGRAHNASPPAAKTETCSTSERPHREFSSHSHLDNLLISKENNSSIINFTAINDQLGHNDRPNGISNGGSNSWPSSGPTVSCGESSQEMETSPPTIRTADGDHVQPKTTTPPPASSSAPPVPMPSFPPAATAPLSTVTPPLSMPLPPSKQAPTLITPPPPPSCSTSTLQQTRAEDNETGNTTDTKVGASSTQSAHSQSEVDVATTNDDDDANKANVNDSKNHRPSRVCGAKAGSNSATAAANEAAPAKEASKKGEKNFRRSSSLKIPKQESLTANPAQKKIVRFADALGLDLADVRTFPDEMPSVPKSAYKDLTRSAAGDEPFGNASAANRTFGATAPLASPPKPAPVPMFKQPGISLHFLERIRDHYVCLEKALVTMQPVCSITGTVRVRNIDFHKSVFVRYTLDHWRSFCEVPAIYVPDSCDGFSDQFSFIIYLYEVPKSHRVELAVRYHCSGSIYWDNNFGANYVFQSLSSPPAIPSYFTCNQTNNDRCHSFY